MCSAIIGTMQLSTSVVILALAASSLVEACPFASSGLAINLENLPKNHPIVPGRKLAGHVAQESLIGLDGRLAGSPKLDNGAKDFPSLLIPIRDDGKTIADIVAEMSTTLEEDMCLIRFQQLPPPEVGNYSFDQNAIDRQSLKDLGDLMTERFSNLSSPDLHMGAIIHASCTIGYGGIESMCNAGIQPERFCADNMTSAVKWPQAITGYKLTNETVDAVKAAIETWRDSDDGHLPSILWSFNGGQPDGGGSQIGYWGNAGGLFSKIVKCSDIPEELLFYEYPNGIGVADYIDPTTNMSVSDMMYEWWVDYGGFDPKTGEQVFGDAWTLPEECRACVEAIPCFQGGGCNAFDLASGTWDSPYDACGPAIACLPCFPECSAEKEAECAECSQAAPCFDEFGCSVLDFDTGTWSAPYDECSQGAFECLPCFPECQKPDDGDDGDGDDNAACGPCEQAAPCFAEDLGCSAFDVDTNTYSPPFDPCTEALACVDLGCFELCGAAEDPTVAPEGPPTAAPVAATKAPTADGAPTMSFMVVAMMMAVLMIC